jgi:hypothetical protein
MSIPQQTDIAASGLKVTASKLVAIRVIGEHKDTKQRIQDDVDDVVSQIFGNWDARVTEKEVLYVIGEKIFVVWDATIGYPRNPILRKPTNAMHTSVERRASADPRHQKRREQKHPRTRQHPTSPPTPTETVSYTHHINQDKRRYLLLDRQKWPPTSTQTRVPPSTATSSRPEA